ncbi:LysR family transcriptional regulator [Noviherbaspirillum pedocola]|uniref:LysR family transcriptional regulator n=1 Tax=Noviherbaspirillum pedocola TaxID=2801341 RepID=A0A934SYQ2_9BURK|nr:LysR family transcriptional regulator [Noviherbaspirillum pedocola]MBK4734183.1 LysR family transcriptional regulator [Noviherbaspirillum pedocola]
MRITLRQLQIFSAVAEHGSTTAAAESLALSQSATSSALNELEDLLAAQLFDRVGKALLLNDSGRMLLEHARQALDIVEDIENAFSGKRDGQRQFRIGASTTIGAYLLPELLAAYNALHGDRIARVSIANTADVAAAVANFDVEIGFIEGPCHVPGLRVEPWIRDELVIVAAPGNEEALRSRAAPATPEQLAEARWLLREPGSGTREAAESALIPYLHYLEEGGQFSSSEAIKHACAAGLGLACLSRAVVADLIALGKLVEVATTLPPLSRDMYLITSRKKTLSPALESLLGFCRSWSREMRSTA